MILSDAAKRRRGVCLAILAAASLLAILFLLTEIRLLLIPSERDYGEGHVLCLTQQILDTSRAYKPVDSLPYIVDPYTPLYMLASRLANLYCDDLLLAGRGLSLLSTLGIAMAVAMTVLLVAPARAPMLWRSAAAAFAGVLPLLTDSVAGWASLMRVDMLALCLMYAGLCVYIAMGKRERWQHAAAVLFVLAVFTKQTMLSAPLACLTFGLLADLRRTIRVFAGAALLTLAGVLGLNSITHGGFLTNVLDYNVNPFSLKSAAIQMYGHFRTNLPWIAIAAAAFLAVWNPVAIRRRGWIGFLQTRSTSPYGRAIILAGLNCAFAAAAMLSLGKAGTNYNHYLAFDISTCLLCGLFVCRLLVTPPVRRNRPRAIALAGIVLPLGLLLPSLTLLLQLQHSPDPPDSARGEEAVLQLIRESPGPVFSENLLLLNRAGKTVEAEPATLSYLARSGRWDEQPYLWLFDSQYFSLLVAYDIYSRERFTPALTLAIERNYVRVQQVGAYSVYRRLQRTYPLPENMSSR